MLGTLPFLASAFLAPPALPSRSAVVAKSPTMTAGQAQSSWTTGLDKTPGWTAPKTGQKLYTKQQALPKAFGALRVGMRQLVVVTGASSGLGLACTKALCESGKYYVVAAVRDTAKMDRVAKELGISGNDYTAMQLELASLRSVKDFVNELRLFSPGKTLNHLM